MEEPETYRVNSRSTPTAPPEPLGEEDEWDLGIPTHTFDWKGPVAAAVTVVLLVAFGWYAYLFASGPYRADRHYWVAVHDQTLARQPGHDAGVLVQQATTAINRAITTNRWEPSYLATEAQGYFNVAQEPSNGSTIDRQTAYGLAVADYAKAVRLAPNDSAILAAYAHALVTAYPGDAARKAEAISLLRRAVQDNPLAPQYSQDLANIQKG
jgi:cytochrome c-type biogenesis protein CcmH/NrfG